MWHEIFEVGFFLNVSQLFGRKFGVWDGGDSKISGVQDTSELRISKSFRKCLIGPGRAVRWKKSGQKSHGTVPSRRGVLGVRDL